MCSHRLVPMWLVLALGSPVGGVAQPAQRWRDSALGLERQVRALRDSLLQGDSTVVEVARRDDLVIGASEPLREAAAAALERFIGERSRWFGGASPSPGGFRIVLRSDLSSSLEVGGLPQELATVVLAGLPDSEGAVRVQRSVVRRRIAENLIDAYAEMMYASAGPVLLEWLQSFPPVSIPEQERQQLAMYALVTGTGRAQRRCVAGALAACAAALGLRAPTDRESGGGYTPIVRADLLLTTLELGGSAAWTRLREAEGELVETALAAAAGMPADSLLARWRSGLLTLRPTEAPVTLPGVLLALGWTAGLLLGALGVARWA